MHRIRHELILAVRESDYEAYAEILSSLNKRGMEIFGDAKDRLLTNGVLMGLTFIWQESIFEAARNNAQQFYKSLWDTIGGLYSYAAKKKAPLLHFQEIEHFVYEHIQYLGRNNMGDALTAGVWMLADAFESNLIGNRPSQEEISDLYDLFDHKPTMPHNVDTSLQWDYIEHFIGLIHDIQQIAITNQDRELYRTCQFYSNNILNDLSHEQYGNLGSYQTAAISINILRYAQYYSDQALEFGLLKNTSGSYDINTSFTTYAIKKEEFYLKQVMTSFSDYIILTQRKGYLDDWTILKFGAIGRHASKFYFNNNVANTTIKFIVRTFNIIKNEIESNQLPAQVINYEAVKRQLESQKEFLLRDNVNLVDPILNEIQVILDGFKSVSKHSGNNIVQWEI